MLWRLVTVLVLMAFRFGLVVTWLVCLWLMLLTPLWIWLAFMILRLCLFLTLFGVRLVRRVGLSLVDNFSLLNRGVLWLMGVVSRRCVCGLATWKV